MLVALRAEALDDVAIVALNHDADFFLDSLVALWGSLRREHLDSTYSAMLAMHRLVNLAIAPTPQHTHQIELFC